jgi:hypothetical protein
MKLEGKHAHETQRAFRNLKRMRLSDRYLESRYIKFLFRSPKENVRSERGC